MPTQTSTAVVQAYLSAYTHNDIETASSLLAEDMRFDGPFVSCSSAQEFIGDGEGPGLAAWAKNLTGYTMTAAMAEGDSVLAVYDVHTRPFGTLPTASHFTVRNGKISTERVIFDATPIHAARAAAQRGTA